MNLRPFAEADFDAVVAQWHATNRTAYAYVPLQRAHTVAGARAFFRDQVLTRCRVFVATAAATPLGLIALEDNWIRQLAVFAPHRRRRVGSALLAQARALSPRELRLYTFQRNAAARRFYESHGFVAVAFGISPAPEDEPDVEYRWTA